MLEKNLSNAKSEKKGRKKIEKMINVKFKNKLFKIDLNTNKNLNNRPSCIEEKQNSVKFTIDMIKMKSLRKNNERESNFTTNTLKTNNDKEDYLITNLDEINQLSANDNSNNLQLLLSPLEVNEYTNFSYEFKSDKRNDDLTDAVVVNDNIILANLHIKNYSYRLINILLSPLETGLLLDLNDFIPIIMNNCIVDKSIVEILLSPLETYYPFGFLNIKASKVSDLKLNYISNKVDNYTSTNLHLYSDNQNLPCKYEDSYSDYSFSSNNDIIHCCYCCCCCSLCHNDVHKSKISLVNKNNLSSKNQTEKYEKGNLKEKNNEER